MKSDNKNKGSAKKYALTIIFTSILMFGAGYLVCNISNKNKAEATESTEIVEATEEDVQVRVYDGQIQLYEDEIWRTVMSMEEAAIKDPLSQQDRQAGLYEEDAVVGLVRKTAEAPEDKDKKQTTYSGGSSTTVVTTPSAGSGAAVSTPAVDTSTEASQPGTDTGAVDDGSSGGDGEDLWSGDIL